MNAARLRDLIEASGLSASRFARDVVGRDVRTVQRWLAGDPIPDSAADWLERLDAVRVHAKSVTLRLRC